MIHLEVVAAADRCEQRSDRGLGEVLHPLAREPPALQGQPVGDPGGGHPHRIWPFDTGSHLPYVETQSHERTFVTVFAVVAATFLSTLAGGIVALRSTTQLGLIIALGAGVRIGAAFFDLVPESARAMG